MADANQQPPAAEKAAEATTPHAAGSTEAPAEKSADAPADETVAAKDEATTTAAAPDAAPQAGEAATTTTTTTTTATTTTTGDEKAALDKETGVVDAKHPATVDSSAASSVVAPAPAGADTKDGETSATSKDATSAPAPAAATTATTAEPAASSSSSPSAPAAKAKTPLDELDAKLPAILEEVGHDEMWGVTLVPTTTPEASPRHVPTAIVLQKFLNANDGDPAAAEAQLRGALEFRKKARPLALLRDKAFSAHKFADLGAVTVYPSASGGVPEVFTWNLYGNVKGKMDEVFVPLEEYAPPPPTVPPSSPPKQKKRKMADTHSTPPPFFSR